MVLTFANGVIVLDGTEQNLFDITADKHFATWVFLDAMGASDTVSIRVYVKDEQDTLMRKYIDVEVSGAQGSPSYFIPWVPTKQYRVSIQRTAGTFTDVSWQRAEA